MTQDNSMPINPGVNEELLRITGACDQSCVFCNTHGMTLQMSIRDVFQQCHDLDRRSVTPTLTGGEPTLHAEFIPMLHLLGEMGFLHYGIQTNAMRFENARFAAAAAGAGMSFAVVSLHSSTAEESDGITGRPGGFERTWKGIRNLLDHGINIVVNHVLCGANFAGAVGFVEYIDKNLYSPLRDKGAAGSLSLSFVQPSGKARGDRAVAPRLTDAAPFYAAAMRRCEELGIHAVNPGCGIPVCFTPGLEELSSELRLIESQSDRPRTIRANTVLKTKGPQCAACLANDRCLGVWRDYAEMYGLDELKPITEYTKTNAGRKSK